MARWNCYLRRVDWTVKKKSVLFNLAAFRKRRANNYRGAPTNFIQFITWFVCDSTSSVAPSFFFHRILHFPSLLFSFIFLRSSWLCPFMAFFPIFFWFPFTLASVAQFFFLLILCLLLISLSFLFELDVSNFDCPPKRTTNNIISVYLFQ